MGECISESLISLEDLCSHTGLEHPQPKAQTLDSEVRHTTQLGERHNPHSAFSNTEDGS